MIIFAGLALYMLVACVLILVKAVKDGANATLYAQIVISLITTLGKMDPCCYYSIDVDLSGILCTIGSWITSSILALDLWRLLTLMLHYLLLAPAYINVLNVYALANLVSKMILVHDITNVEQPY
ncbi:hypothetical protein PGTUg99_029042 [Puccinia graminis f. sp. tritici]|uniref:Uncharacterized protein n=1 Tax=Puccinia graminis f. sp. tritici TaxID=56615 RepID=A0A5B0PPT9_PUCGR|nr:hypothetical protein PGTUg99_029042 [Puccinia graminis f. sp. tritici]